MDMQKCTACNTDRLTNEIIKGKGYCRYCARKWDKERYYRNKDRRLQEQKERLSTPEGKKERRKWERSYYYKSKERYLAYAKVRYAIITGKLLKPIHCEDCGTIAKLQAHHDDYTKPLNVKWLCLQCHNKIPKTALLAVMGVEK